MKRSVWIIVVLVIGTFVLAVLGATEPFLLILTIGMGWVPYLGRILPEVQIGWPAVATGLLCLGATLVLGHAMASWLWRETQSRNAVPWRLHWSVIGLVLVLLMFVSGIAATGITHQTGWLIRSDESMFTGYRPSHAIHCGSNMRQIGYMLKEYADEHGGQFPDSLEGIEDEFASEMRSCPAPDGGPWVYHGRGRALPLPDDFVLISEPLVYHRGRGMNVLFGDLSVRHLPPEEAEVVMRRSEQEP